jgi:hypothetical protein
MVLKKDVEGSSLNGSLPVEQKWLEGGAKTFANLAQKVQRKCPNVKQQST